MSFNVKGALDAGYTMAEIADHLASQSKFDTAAARKAGYADDEIVSHLAGSAKTQQPTQAQQAQQAQPREGRPSSEMNLEFRAAPQQSWLSRGLTAVKRALSPYDTTERMDPGDIASAQIAKETGRGTDVVLAPERRVQKYYQHGVKPIPASIATGVTRQAGGALQWAGENVAPRSAMLGPVLGPLSMLVKPQTYVDKGKEIAEEGRMVADQIAKEHPVEPGTFTSMTRSAGTSFGTQLPGLAASAMTGNPLPALISMSGMTAADKYGEYRAGGHSLEAASLAAAGHGLIEGATELIPVGKFLGLAGGKQHLVKSLIEMYGAEIPGEMIATVTQDMIDKGMMRPNMTMGEAGEEIKKYFTSGEAALAQKETIGTTLIQTTLQGGLGVMSRAANRMAQKKLQTPTTPQATQQPTATAQPQTPVIPQTQGLATAPQSKEAPAPQQEAQETSPQQLPAQPGSDLAKLEARQQKLKAKVFDENGNQREDVSQKVLDNYNALTATIESQTAQVTPTVSAGEGVVDGQEVQGQEIITGGDNGSQQREVAQVGAPVDQQGTGFPTQPDVHAEELSASLEANGLPKDHPAHQAAVEERRQRERTPDAQTGLISREHHQPTLERAWKEHTDTKRNFAYADVDIANLGGLNTHSGGNEQANVHLKAMADIIQREVQAAHPQAQVFRKGGDEFGIIAPDATEAELEAAMEKARAAVSVYAQEQGLDQIPHSKVGNPPGVGIEFGITEYAGKKGVSHLLNVADARTHQAKMARKEGDKNVNGKQVEAARAVAPEGQAGGTGKGAGKNSGTTKAEGQRRGEIGGKLSEGEIVLTATGRQTTPFPKLSGKGNAAFKRVNAWLIENATEEARSRGDEFNLLQFENMNLKNLSQSDKDSAEMYLFSDSQPSVIKSILKDLVPKKEEQQTKAEASNKPTKKGPHLTVDTAKDDIIKAISKLGGIDFAEASREWGATITDQVKAFNRKGVFGHPVIRKNNGLPIDKMVEGLAQLGYLPVDENGKASMRDLGDALDRASRGETIGITNFESTAAELEAAEIERIAGEMAEIAADEALLEGEEVNAETKAELFSFFDDLIGEVESEGRNETEATREAEGGTAEAQKEGAPEGKGETAGETEEKAIRFEKTEAGDQGKLFATPPAFGKKQQGKGTAEETPMLTEMKEREAEKKQQSLPEGYGEQNAVFTKDRADKARELLRQKLNQLNAGLDPEMIQAGIDLAGYHIEAGARTFANYARKMVDGLGEAIRPYLKSFYLAVRNYPGFDNSGMETEAQVEASIAEDNNAERGNADLERDSRNTEAENIMGEEDVRADGRKTDEGVRVGGEQAEDARFESGRDPLLPRSETIAPGENGNPEIQREQLAGSAERTAGSEFGQRSGDFDVTGETVEPVATGAVEKAAARSLDLQERLEAQKAAQGVKVIPGDRANIDESLPILFEGQREDVAFAEERFSQPDGYGVMFTNGTGTGKTYSGLGIIKRLERQGKKNIIIVAPSDNVISDWIKSGKSLMLDISALSNTKDAGKGIVITTYENFGQNEALVNRRWDMVLFDESHKLNSNQSGDATKASDMMQAITLHPSGVWDRTRLLHPDLFTRIDAAREAKDQTLLSKLDLEFNAAKKAVQEDVKANQGAARPRVVFLSATPFAYEKNIDYADGYLFNYNEGQGDDSGRMGYNSGSNRDRFFMTHFGYRMRYNKLTEPPAEVDRGIMQRQFNSWMKSRKVISGRMLDVEHDYDRRFILVESAIGRKIDEGLEYLQENEQFRPLYGGVMKRFDYLSRRFLLEAIKAKEAVPHIQEHLAMGRKVVVFHDYKQGGGINPFDVRGLEGSTEEIVTGSGDDRKRVLLRDIAKAFIAARPDLISLPFGSYGSALSTLKNAFPEALIVNGDESKKNNVKAAELFQDDDSGRNLIIVQADKGKEGISLHDTTSKHQRVLFNLGLPVKPTMAIQQEGRIYRTGQASNAIMRYLNTGTNWERFAFATTIARRASTAENLASGEQARMLLDAFVQGFEESDDYRAGHEGEGTGGKERDRAANAALTEWDRAITYYFGQRKGRQNDVGTDYFATPEPLGLKMVEWADIRPGDMVLEPSGGHGAIARWFPEHARRRMIEPSLELSSRAALVFDGDIVQGQFEDHNPMNKYDAIVMNPPFGSGGSTAIAHLEKASRHLKDGGRIVAIIPRGPAADKKFDKWMDGEETRPVDPIGRLEDGTKIFKGDTLTIRSQLVGRGSIIGEVSEHVVTRIEGDFFYTADKDFPGVNLRAIQSVNPTGKREAKIKNDLYLAAEILLPSVTFERAGTKVSARIVVLDKSEDVQQASRDYSDSTDIKEFFGRIEGSTIQGRKISVPEVPKQADTPKQVGGVTLASFTHTRTGKPLFVAALNDRVDKEAYATINSIAKKHKGYFNSYTKGGAIKGFVFESEESRNAFVQEAFEDNVQAEVGAEFGTVGEEGITYEIDSVSEGKGRDYQSKTKGSAKTKGPDNVDGAGGVQLSLFTVEGTPADKQKRKIISFAKAEKVVTGTMRSGLSTVKTPEEAAHVVASLRKYAQEAFVMVVTGSKGEILGVVHHSSGSLNQSIVHPRDALGVLYSFPGVRNIWFAHNHPSGDPQPSKEDFAITKRLEDAVSGSSIKFKGMVIVGSGTSAGLIGKDSEYRNISIAAGNRKLDIPVFGRKIRKIVSTSATRITSAEIAKQFFLEQNLDGETGIVLLNSKNQAASWVPMSMEEMSRLRTGDIDTGSSVIMKAFADANAAAAILKVEDTIADRGAIENIAAFGKVLGGEILDAIDAKGRSARSSVQGMGDKTTFFSLRRNTAEILVNPTRSELYGMIRDSRFKELRVVKDPDTGDLYVADAGRTYHKFIAQRAGLDWAKIDGNPDLMFIVGQGDFSRAINPGNNRYSIPLNREQGIDLSEMKKAVNPILKKWKGAPKVVVVQSESDLPAEVQREITSQNAQGEVNGIFTEDGIYLVADNTADVNEAVKVLLHEVVGHYGVRGMMGDKFRSLLFDVFQLYGKKGLQDIADRYGLDLNKQADRLIAAEEKLSELAESGEKPGLVKRAIAAIREWLRSVGITVDLSDNDVKVLISRAAGWVERGQNDLRKIGKDIRFSAAWHGSPHEFDKFSTGAIGTGEGAQAYGYGLYFAGTKEVAEHYKRSLSNYKVSVNGREIDVYTDHPTTESSALTQVLWEVDNGKPDIDKTLSRMEEYAQRDFLSAEGKENWRKQMQWLKENRNAIELGSKGSLYKVELAPQEDEYLLWDRPLSEQSGKVKKALEKAQWDNNAIIGKLLDTGLDFDGKDFYQRISSSMGDTNNMGDRRNDRAASEYLHSLGIRGIKYLDGTSRNRPIKEIKKVFLDALPEDATFDEVMELIGGDTFSPEQERVLKALEQDDWLGFDYPAQAISVALGKDISGYDASQELKAAVKELGRDSTYNYVVFSDEDVEITARFRRRNRTGDAETDAILDKIGRPEKTLKERLSGFIGDRVKLRLEQGIFDQFAAIKPVDETAYKMARLTTGFADTFTAMLNHGAPVWKKGWVQVDGRDKGIMKIFEPVAEDLDLFLGWMVGERAQKLMNEGRERYFTRDEIYKLKALKTKENAARWEEVRRNYVQYKTKVLDFAEQAGVINPEARQMWDHEEYVPFYRIAEDSEKPAGPRGKKGIASQNAGIRKLTGGTDQLGDIFENILQNFSHLTQASIKNRAAEAALDKAEEMGVVTKAIWDWKAARIETDQIVKKIREQLGDEELLDPEADQLDDFMTLFHLMRPKGTNIIHVLKNGKPQYYEVHDGLFLSALTNINAKVFTGAVMDSMRFAKRLLTIGITSMPDFMVRNFVRDTLHTWAISRGKFTPAISSLKGVVKTFREDNDMVQLMAAGGSFHGGFAYGHDMQKTAKHVKKLMHKKKANILDTPAKLLDFWKKVGAAGENAARISVFYNALEETGSEFLAAFEARDIMDFSMRGDFAAVKLLCETVPFLGARIQGLQRLGKEGIENPKTFLMKGSMIAMASVLLYLVNSDDDRYKELEEWDKDSYFHFWIGKEHFRLPKPFEVGVMFGTIPERLTELIVSDNPDGKLFASRLKHAITDTFAVGLPQLVSPLVQQWANKDSFTGRDIVGQRLKYLKPEDQKDPWTSPTAIELGQAVGASPKRIEHLVESYFGTLGAYVLGASDMVVRKASDYPEKPSTRVEDLPVIKSFYKGSEPPRTTKYVTELYSLLNEVDKTYNSIKQAKEAGDVERFNDLRSGESLNLLRARGTITGAGEQLSEINKMSRKVMDSKSIPGDRKRVALDKLNARKNAIAKAAVQRVEAAGLTSSPP